MLRATQDVGANTRACSETVSAVQLSLPQSRFGVREALALAPRRNPEWERTARKPISPLPARGTPSPMPEGEHRGKRRLPERALPPSPL